MYRVMVGWSSRNTAHTGSSYDEALAVYESKNVEEDGLITLETGSLWSYLLGDWKVLRSKYVTAE